MKRFLFIPIAVILASMLIFGGCAEPTTTPTPTPTTPQPTTPQPTPTPTPGGPQYGGTLKIILNVSINSLGYPGLKRHTWDCMSAAPCIEPLMGIDSSGKPLPLLATDWKTGSDLKSITFTLRKGVKFHDGTDFNAEAVKVNLDAYRETLLQLELIEDIDVIDDYTVRINLKQFDSSLLISLADYPGLMISPTAYKANGRDWCVANPVGTGPFKFVSWNRDVSIKYTKFDDYWQKDRPYLDGIEMNWIADPTVASVAFQSGEADMWMTSQPKETADLRDNTELTVVFLEGSVMSAAYDSAHQDSPFADVRVRKAAGYAIDWDAIAKASGFGFYQSINQLATKAMWAYNPNVVGTPYDPAKAKQLLAEAGYADGFDTKIISMQTGVTPTIFTAIQRYLQAVGIDSTMEAVPSAAFTEARGNGWNGIIYHTIHACVADDAAVNIKKSFPPGMRWVSIVETPDVREKLNQSLLQTEFPKKQALVQEAMKMIIDDYALVSAGMTQGVFCVLSPSVKDAHLFDYAMDNWATENVWLKK